MGYRIKEIRESLNMTQAELSIKSGVSRVTISGLENGSMRATSTKTLTKLANALGVTIDKIFFAKDA